MDSQKRKFAFALALYLGWVLVLGFLAFTSGEPPRPRLSPPAAR